MKVLSRKPLSEDTRRKIEEIFRESNCPNESLQKTFDNCNGLIGGMIFFDDVTFGDYSRGEVIVSDVRVQEGSQPCENTQ